MWWRWCSGKDKVLQVCVWRERFESRREHFWSLILAERGKG